MLSGALNFFFVAPHSAPDPLVAPRSAPLWAPSGVVGARCDHDQSQLNSHRSKVA